MTETSSARASGASCASLELTVHLVDEPSAKRYPLDETVTAILDFAQRIKKCPTHLGVNYVLDTVMEAIEQDTPLASCMNASVHRKGDAFHVLLMVPAYAGMLSARQCVGLMRALRGIHPLAELDCDPGVIAP